jgi:hypothetical protein
MTDHAHPFKRLTQAEALRALYVDFEGEKGRPPVLLGVHRRGRGARPFVQQDVLDAAFVGLAGICLSLHDAVEKVVRRAEHGDRRIVAWSEHELDVVRTLRDEDPGIVARFEARFANARAVAERWRNRLHDGVRPEPGRLVDYLALVGYRVPDEAAGGDVGETIRALRPRLERGLSPTPAQQARWDRLLEHNRHDCAGMRRVCLAATREVDGRDGGRRRTGATSPSPGKPPMPMPPDGRSR